MGEDRIIRNAFDRATEISEAVERFDIVQILQFLQNKSWIFNKYISFDAIISTSSPY